MYHTGTPDNVSFWYVKQCTIVNQVFWPTSFESEIFNRQLTYKASARADSKKFQRSIPNLLNNLPCTCDDIGTGVAHDASHLHAVPASTETTKHPFHSVQKQFIPPHKGPVPKTSS